MNRRETLLAISAVGAAVVVRPAGADSGPLEATLRAYTGGAPITPGRVRIEIAELVDNGNSVPVVVSVDSPMTPAEHVVVIALFNEKNPERDVFRATLGPGLGRARIATRMRLATSQKLVAVAKLSDGRFFQGSVEVLVTLAACIED